MQKGDVTPSGVFLGEVMVPRVPSIPAPILTNLLALECYHSHLPLPGGKSPEFFARWAVAYAYDLNGVVSTVTIEADSGCVFPYEPRRG